jgi:hypothetical protein
MGNAVFRYLKLVVVYLNPLNFNNNFIEKYDVVGKLLKPDETPTNYEEEEEEKRKEDDETIHDKSE